MSFTLGLVSVSFRGLSADEIIKITKKASLSSLEWGGDVHVPAGKDDVAAMVGDNTRSACLEVRQYGSYYRIGASAPDDIDGVVRSASALGTSTIRIWAYNKGSDEVSDAEYKAAVIDARRICAKYPDIDFCTECHNNTLTDDYKANLKLIQDVDMPNFFAFWQPNQYKSHEYNLEAARALSPYVKAVHVFAWDGEEKLPLQCHKERWAEYLEAFRGLDVGLMLEFMHDGSPLSLDKTADDLRNIVFSLHK